MALSTPTTLTSNSNGSGATSRTTGSFTPTANAVLFAAFHANGSGTPTAPTFSDSAGLTWTGLFDIGFNSTDRVTVKWAEVGGSPASMTVTADYSGFSTNQGSWGVVELTGHTPGAPVVSGSTATGSGTSTTPATSAVPALASAANVQLLWIASRSNASTREASSSWLELFDRVGGTNCHLSCYWVGTPGDTSPSAVLAGSALWRAMAAEVESGGLSLAPSGSQLTVQDGSPTYAGAFNAFRGLVIKWA